MVIEKIPLNICMEKKGKKRRKETINNKDNPNKIVKVF